MSLVKIETWPVGARITTFPVIKTKEMIVDYRKRRTEYTPIHTDRAVVEQVESFNFLGVHITNKLEWSNIPRQS